MKSATLGIRTAFFDALQGIVYKGVTIPVWEEVINGSISVIGVGNMQAEAYIIIQNQTANDISVKCRRTDECSIQVQINTRWAIGTGGSKSAEEIGELVCDKLFTATNLETSVVLDSPFQMWKSKLESTRNIPYQTEDKFVWVHNMVFTAWVSQN